MVKINYENAKKELFRVPKYVEPEKVKLKINAVMLRFNCCMAVECYRELMVSFFPMLPLLKEEVEFEEADYILYAHPYARVEDMSPSVIRQLQAIDRRRKVGAEIIVVGKAANVEAILNGSISNITFYEAHFTEILGKRFGVDIKEEYFVADTSKKIVSDTSKKIVSDAVINPLNIWPVNGCLRKCKFCRRSYMNIPFESLSLEAIKRELDFLQKMDPKAMTFIRLRAENLTEYGMDIDGKSCLPELFELLDSYKEIKWVAIIIGLAPCEITDEILSAICKFKKLVQINMNPEVGSNRMFELSGKDITRERTIYIFQEIRKAHPKIYIESTIMVGFPTETLIDIYELADLIEQTEPDVILINLVGIAPKTPLAELPQLSENLREYHLKVLVHLLKKQKRKRVLRIKYPKIFKKGTRSEDRFKKKKEERWNEYSLLTIPRKTLVLKP